MSDPFTDDRNNSMASHNQPESIFPRTIAGILIDLYDARQDWADAIEDCERGEDADDRATEADQRTAELRAEFALAFLEATAVPWSHIEKAIENAIL